MAGTSENKTERTGKPAGRILRGILLAVFSAGLLLGLYHCIRTVRSNAAASSAYSQLSSRIQNTGGSGTGEEDAEKKDILKPHNGNGDHDPARDDKAAPGDSDGMTDDFRMIRQQSMDFAALQKINPGIAAWIRAEEIGIDYPVMYTDNNTFYLTHLYDGTENPNGALFIDCNNPEPFRDRNTAVYGHNMQSGAMFHALNGYRSQEYYGKCPAMMLYTPEGDYRIELVSGTVENGDTGFIRFQFESEEDFIRYVDKLKAGSTFRSEVKLQPGDRLISMCTCTSDSPDNLRYLLVGKLTELYEKESAVQ